MRLTVCALPILMLTAIAAHADLFSYVAKPEPEASWKVASKNDLGTCEMIAIKLKSQVWEGIAWEHDLVIFRPKTTEVQDKLFLLNSGGKMKPEGLPYGVMLAAMMKAPVAMLLGIPNQPLFEGKTEDNLIAETFVRYLDTKDDGWPLLFPMVKSIVKAMDAVQEYSAQEWPQRVEKFIVSGASKRGWTTWLTAAADPRVMAIAPMVIDVLKMPEQMQRQFECFGGPSEQILPYTARGLIPMAKTEEAQRLWRWVDPYSYRANYTMPKLIVLGNNDRYWAPDALNLYWDELPGEKWINYTPNAGHSLVASGAGGGTGGPLRAVQAIAAFVRHQFTGQPMPELTWKHDELEGQPRLTVTSKPAPREMHAWRCQGATKDLREARWESRPVVFHDGTAEILEPRPIAGVVSFYADCSYEIDGLPYTLCTQLRLVEPR